MTAPKRLRGRPRAAEPRPPRQIRMTDAEWAEVQAAAEREAMTASAWARALLLRAARQTS